MQLEKVSYPAYRLTCREHSKQWMKEYLFLCHIIKIAQPTWDYMTLSNTMYYVYLLY